MTFPRWSHPLLNILPLVVLLRSQRRQLRLGESGSAVDWGRIGLTAALPLKSFVAPFDTSSYTAPPTCRRGGALACRWGAARAPLSCHSGAARAARRLGATRDKAFSRAARAALGRRVGAATAPPLGRSSAGQSFGTGASWGAAEAQLRRPSPHTHTRCRQPDRKGCMCRKERPRRCARSTRRAEHRKDLGLLCCLGMPWASAARGAGVRPFMPPLVAHPAFAGLSLPPPVRLPLGHLLFSVVCLAQRGEERPAGDGGGNFPDRTCLPSFRRALAVFRYALLRLRCLRAIASPSGPRIRRTRCSAACGAALARRHRDSV